MSWPPGPIPSKSHSLTGTLRWYTADQELAALECPMGPSAMLVCDLSPLVTFFRNTETDVWLFFVPRTTMLGPLPIYHVPLYIRALCPGPGLWQVLLGTGRFFFGATKTDTENQSANHFPEAN